MFPERIEDNTSKAMIEAHESVLDHPGDVEQSEVMGSSVRHRRIIRQHGDGGKGEAFEAK